MDHPPAPYPDSVIPAPLAQLRNSSHELWSAVYSADDMSLKQALAAALLGDRDLAQKVVESVGGWRVMEWPRLPGAEAAVNLGPKIEMTHDGQRVSFVVDGVIERYDREKGFYVIRGNSRGAQHLDWKIKAHWGTEFHERQEKR